MKDKPADAERLSLSRWSRRKLEANAAERAVPPAASVATVSGTPAPAPTELPSVDSLSFDSDFAAFLRPEVDEKLKRAALKQLFRDPRFNVMDGLDTYIDDYTKADPIPADMLQGLLQRFAAVASTGREEKPEPAEPGSSPPVAKAAAKPLPAAESAAPSDQAKPEPGAAPAEPDAPSASS